MLSAGKGKFRVWLKETRQGKDIVLMLGGGDRPHVGSVVLCTPGRKPFVINRKGHFDWIIAKPIAKKACEKRKRPVVCIAGVHVDNASDAEIRLLKENCRKLEKKL